MAITDGKFLRGVAGNHVLRKYRGKQVFGMKPYTPKSSLTQATLKAAKTFGIASTLAKHIRQPLNTIVNDLYDGTMTYRLNTDTLYCLNGVKNPETQAFAFQSDSFERLNGFDFNADSPFKNNLLIQPEIIRTDTKIQVILPELDIPQDIRFPKGDKGNSLCRFIVTVLQIDLSNGKYKSLPVQSVEIPYTANHTVFAGHTFEFDAEPGCLCITAASLQFVKTTTIGERSLNTKMFSPAAILDAYLFDGQANSENDHIWNDFFSKKWKWTEVVNIQD